MSITTIISFDKTEKNQGSLLRPESYSELASLKYSRMIARGAGLSYCNASFCENGYAIDMSAFNRVLNFNPEMETVTVEAGITIGELNNFLNANGWIMPVLPGYPAITVGGCVAFNVHGKSQYNIGTIMDWTEQLTLFHPFHGEISCSEIQNKELFDLTVGGLGLTGIIISVRLRIKKLSGNSLDVKAVKASNLLDALRILYENAGSFDHLYSWNDLNLRGNFFGKGIVYLEKYNSSFLPVKNKNYKNRLQSTEKFYNLQTDVMVKLMSVAYQWMERIKPAYRHLDLQDASFPIYGKETYFHLFGRRGFREYQVLFPFNRWEQAAGEIKELISETRMAVALSSLKIFKGKQHNLSFSGEGVCLTIDIPNNEKVLNFFGSLDRITLKYEGIINLSKDSRASMQLVSQLFPAYGVFKQEINKWDVKKNFTSELSKRIGL